MNKQEYMYNLFEALRPFEEEVRDEIISDYEEHFSMGIAAGKTEEQIVEELGSIDELIADLNELKGGKKASKEGNAWNFDGKEFAEGAEKFAKGVANFFGSFVGKATNGAEKMGETFADGFSNVAEKVFEKSNEFAKEVSDGFRAARGEEPKGEESQNLGEDVVLDVDDIDNIKVESDCGNIFVKKSEDDKLHITYKNYGTPNQVLAYKFTCYKQDNGTVYAKAAKQIGNANFFRALVSPKIEIFVDIPEELDSIVLSTASGEIQAEEISADSIKINDVSGKVSLTLAEADSININNVSGTINVANCKCDQFVGKTVSGSINAGVQADEVKLSTTSGAIHLSGSEFDNIKCSSVSGSIHIAIEDGTGFNASASSTSGSINLSCGESHIKGSRSGNYVMGDGGTKINASSVSGSVTIECTK